MTIIRFQGPPIGVHSLLLASLTESPEIVVPSKSFERRAAIMANCSAVSSIPYNSKITQEEEHLPFAVGIMGVPGNENLPAAICSTNASLGGDLVLMDTIVD